MRRITIPTLLALSALFGLVIHSSLNARDTKAVPAGAQSITASFLNLGGIVLQPGQIYEVKWDLQGEGVKYFENNPWSECELFFSTDNGRTWSRITPHLGVQRRTFTWVVPEVSTQTALLALQIGVEGEGEFYTFPSKPFSVLNTWGPAAGAE